MKKNSQAEQLEQEETNFLKLSVSKKVAEDNGLSIDDDNLRKVD